MKQHTRLFACSLILALLLLLSSAFSTHPAQAAEGKSIDVNLTKQDLTAYAGDKQVYHTLVLTGRPGLDTPIGTYQVFAKLSPTTFISPFPASSPNYYPPTHISYALEFKEGGYFLHDSWWHTKYGPGTQDMHTDPVYGSQNGSHGCVSMPLAAASWLYSWAPIGTTVHIHF